MPDEIEPALTAGQWAAMGRDRKNGESPVSQIRFSFGNGPFNPFGPFALMALANAALPDEDPRKITREDVVDELDAYHAAVIFARWCEDNGMPGKSIEAKQRAARHGQRAAKLAALLPPEG